MDLLVDLLFAEKTLGKGRVGIELTYKEQKLSYSTFPEKHYLEQWSYFQASGQSYPRCRFLFQVDICET